MEPDHLREDLKSEVILIICELPEDKIKKLHDTHELEFYTVRVILNLIKSNTSSFAKKYRSVYSDPTNMADHPIDDINDIVERAEKERVEDIALGEIDNLYWYKSELIKLYMELGNYRAIEEATGIPYISCYKNIKASFDEIKIKASQRK